MHDRKAYVTPAGGQRHRRPGFGQAVPSPPADGAAGRKEILSMSDAIRRHLEAVSLKALAVDDSGSVQVLRTIGPLTFSFTSLDLPWACRFHEADGQASLVVAAPLVPLPSDNPQRKLALLQVIEAACAAGLPISLRSDGWAVYGERFSLETPVTPEKLITILGTHMLALEPWLALLRVIAGTKKG